MADNVTQCPRCGNMTDMLTSIDPGMRVALQEAGGVNAPDRVCSACFDQLTSTLSQGLKLRMERDAREKNKMVIWKNRVHLIKNARTCMQNRQYSEAAVQYEKYIKVLEVVYNLKRGELSPSIFNNSKRSKELTVIASAYWDLVRIYDTNPRYGDRMAGAAKKLAEFLPFSTIYPDIVKKAEGFARQAKNPAVIRQFLKQSQSSRGPCFIADAAFADEPFAATPTVLRRYRDERLRVTRGGRRLIWMYYRMSPSFARSLRRHPRAAAFTRWALRELTNRFVARRL